MALFNRKTNNQNSVVWRDASGKIACPGDNCPKDCDNTCPIFLNTSASMMLTIGQQDAALSVYKEIIEMAPDFYDAWNNMAAVYGGQRQYQKANECYAKAHELSPERPMPIYGLALTTKDLERYEECLKWCDEYDRIAKDHRLDGVRATALSALGQPVQKGNTPEY